MKLTEMTKPIYSDMVLISSNDTVTTSLKVAEYFGKDHHKVMRDIRERILPNVSTDFNQSNFGLVPYIDVKGEERPMYYITFDGCMMLIMSYTGQQAMQIKEAYIREFNRMRIALQQNQLDLQRQIQGQVHSEVTKLLPQLVKTQAIEPPKEFLTLETAPDMLTVKEIKQLLHIGQRQAYELVHRKGFPAKKIGASIRIPKHLLIEWLNKN